MVATAMGGALMASVALRPEDLLVEYRNKSLGRDGSIPLQDLRLKMQPVYNGVGAWMVQLPAEHRAASYLRAPGAGIIVTNLKTGQTLFSGSTSKPSKKASIHDAKGLVTIAGLSDDRLLWDALAFADPTNADPAAATVANDVRTAVGSTLMRLYVTANIGPASPVGRRGTSLRNAIVLGADPALGATTTRRPRYDVLGDLLKGIAQETGMGFRLVQVGTSLQFQVYQPVNRTSTIRLDIHNGTLQDQEVEHAPPEVTRMIVAGQGEGVERQMISMTTAASTTAESDWGLIIEEFRDQRNTDVVDELEAAGLERLNDAGFTKVALKAVPSNDQTMIFLTDFFMGDRVSVVIEDQEQPNSIITEAAIVVDSQGITTAVAIGDIADFDSDSYLRQQLTDTQKRVDNLERNAEATAPPSVSDLAIPGEIKIWTTNTAPSGWLICNGASLLRSTYPKLFAAIGVTFGSVDGTHFNIPNLLGRVVVQRDPAQVEFDTLGETGGTKTHTLGVSEMPFHGHQQRYTTTTFAVASVTGALGAMTGVGSGNMAGNSGQDTNGNGGNSPHNNIQPYATLNYIIRGS